MSSTIGIPNTTSPSNRNINAKYISGGIPYAPINPRINRIEAKKSAISEIIALYAMSFASQLFLLFSLEFGPIPTIINLEPATITADNKAITCNPPNETDETVAIPDKKTSCYVILSTAV